MAYVTDYEYSVDRKTALLSFYDDSTPLCTYSLANNVVTVSARDEVVVVSPTWGTNRDIKEWFNLLSSMSGRLELVEGTIRDGCDYALELDGSGVKGTLTLNSGLVADWDWELSTDTLTIQARDECAINFREFRLYMQWMLDFQFLVQNYGG